VNFMRTVCRFMPSDSAVNGIGDTIKSHYIDPLPS
jgi:hypothetical protein